MYCIVLYCSVLYCIALYDMVWYGVRLYYVVLYCIVLYYIVLYCIVLYCIVLYCIVLYCIVLYWASRITNRLGCVPTNSKTRSAIRLCRFQCSTATATIRPPTNNTLVSLKYGGPTSLELSTPNKGNRTSGSSDVTARGTTSDTQ